MYLKSLGLEQFRCYSKANIEFGPGLFVLVGGNAAGKTSILEAIHLLAATKSHRTSADRELVQWDQQWSRVSGVFETRHRGEVSLRVTLQPGGNGGAASNGVRKTVEVNSVPRRRLTDIVGQTAVVLFGPDDLDLIKGSPSVRRRFLNEAISQVRAPYLSDLSRYKRAVRQRNEALKAAAHNQAQREILAAWDSQLIEAAAHVSNARAEFIRALSKHVRDIHSRLSAGREQVDIGYTGSLAQVITLDEKRDRMRELLAKRLDRDIILGRTTTGPHRDDLEVAIDGNSLRNFGSQGQQRTAALSLTLGVARVIQEWREEAPIVLLDDCLSELDEHRARQVLELTENVEQVIVSTASWDRLLDEYATSARIFDIQDGQAQERARSV